ERAELLDRDRREPALLAELPSHRFDAGFAVEDAATREPPLALGRGVHPPDEEDAVLRVHDQEVHARDRYGPDDLGVEVVGDPHVGRSALGPRPLCPDGLELGEWEDEVLALL